MIIFLQAYETQFYSYFLKKLLLYLLLNKPFSLIKTDILFKSNKYTYIDLNLIINHKKNNSILYTLLTHIINKF